MIIYKKIFLLLCVPFCISAQINTVNRGILPADSGADIKEITAMLDNFHAAAAKADFNTYFNYFTDDAVFIGTDAEENWNKKEFMVYAKPYFDKGRAWSFTALERHIYFGKNDDIAWFDELLNTQMKICRGSGVVVKENNTWKVQQYVLSMTVPNSESDRVINIKSAIEDSLIQNLSGEK